MSQDSGDLGSLPSNFLEVFFFLIVLFSVLFIIVLVLFV